MAVFPFPEFADSPPPKLSAANPSPANQSDIDALNNPVFEIKCEKTDETHIQQLLLARMMNKHANRKSFLTTPTETELLQMEINRLMLNADYIPHASSPAWKSVDFMLKAISLFGSERAFCYVAMKNASEEVRKHKGVVMAAVAIEGMSLAYASQEMQEDEQVVLAAIQENVDALAYASFEMRKNPDVIIVAVKKSTSAFLYASEDLKSSLDFVLRLIEHLSYKQASYMLTGSTGLSTTMCKNPLVKKAALDRPVIMRAADSPLL